MNGVSELHEAHIDVGCYVVDALDPAERETFEMHLIGCASCTREVLEFTETAAELARLVAMGPPPAVRGAMLATIQAVRPLPPEIEPSPAVPVPATPEPVVSATDELGARRSRTANRRNRLLAVLVAAAAVAALALGGFVIDLTRQHQADVATRSIADRQTELFAAPDAQVLSRTDDGARYTFVVSKARNSALLISGDLPDPGPGRTFQLWTLRGRQAVPDATMPAGTASQWFTGPIRDSTSLAVTIEPAGGSRQPTMPILAQVSI